MAILHFQVTCETGGHEAYYGRVNRYLFTLYDVTCFSRIADGETVQGIIHVNRVRVSLSP